MEVIVQGTSNGTDERVLYSDDEGSSWEEMTFPEDVEFKYGAPFKSQDEDVFCFYESLGNNFLIFGDSGDPVGMKDASLKSIKLYPNPAEDKLYFEEPINGYTRIINIQGQLVKELNLVNQNSISIDEINPGMYIIEVNNQHTSFIKK